MAKTVTVVGAGITGVTTAYALAKRGFDVTIVDKHDYAGMQTSYANGGQLSVSNAEVWTTWPNVRKGLKWMLKQDAPLLINPKPSWSKIKWLSGFMGHVLRDDYRSNTLKTIELGLRARELYLRIADEEGIEFDLSRCGILHVYDNPDYFGSAVESCKLFRGAGVDRHPVSASQIYEIEPAFTHSDRDFVGGTYTPDDCTGDIHKFCVSLLAVLKEKYNVRTVFGHDYFDCFTLAADHVVICTGVDLEVAKNIGENLNIYPVKGYSITIDDPYIYGPEVSILDDAAKIVTSRLGSRLRVAGTAELNGWNYDIRADRIQPLKDWVKKNFPDMTQEHVVPWAGLRPMTPSMLPIVRAAKKKNFWLNTGHGHLGWTLSPATAEIIANEIEKSV